MFGESQVKIADLFVSMQLISVDNNSAEASLRNSLKNNNLDSLTQASRENITQFNTKYNVFENQQFNKLDSKQQMELTKQDNTNFDSTSYKSKDETPNPIISNLIERGEALKNEMIKSSSSITKPPTNFTSNIPQSLSSLKIPFEHSFILPQQSDTPVIGYDTFNEFIDHDPNDYSRLTDPMHDPDVLSALLYNQCGNDSTSYFQQTTSFKVQSSDEDKELKELLEPPTDVLSKLKIKQNDFSSRSK